MTSFTDRPARRASAESLAEFVEQWPQRGFEDDPPNAALVVDAQPEDGDTAIFEIANPRYDEASGQVTYRATQIDEGTAALPVGDKEALPPAKFGDAHLFIDPGSTPTTEFFLSVTGAPNNSQTQITFDSQFTVAVGAQEAAWAGPTLGGTVSGSSIKILGSAGTLDVFVGGGSPPISGSARVPSGANVTVEVGNSGPQKISSGRFSLSD